MPFSPERTVRVMATDKAAALAVAAELPQMLVTNGGPAVVFVRTGTGVKAAAAHADLPVLSGMQLLLTKGVGADSVALICAGGETATVYVTVGTGT